jgi:hypothetical protein
MARRQTDTMNEAKVKAPKAKPTPLDQPTRQGMEQLLKSLMNSPLGGYGRDPLLEEYHRLSCEVDERRKKLLGRDKIYQALLKDKDRASDKHTEAERELKAEARFLWQLFKLRGINAPLRFRLGKLLDKIECHTKRGLARLKTTKLVANGEYED